MPLAAWCQWIQSTAVSAALRESTWGFPIVGALHVLGIAWFGGALLVADLRRMGVALRSEPLAEVARPLRWWMRTGLAAMLLTGGLLFWVEPLKCYQSTAFRAKMGLLLLLAANAWLHRRAATPGRLRLAAACSLALWAAVILAARGIAFL